MRSIFLPLAMLTAAGGCGSNELKPAAHSVPERDLTLQIQRPSARLEIASPVELDRQSAPEPRRRSAEKSALRSAPGEFTMVPAVFIPVSTLPGPEPLTIRQLDPVIPVTEPINARELPPGKTVTVIPSSESPSVRPDPRADVPPGLVPPMMRGGGTCHGCSGAVY